MTKLILLFSQWLATLTRKLRNNFYLILAFLFTFFVLMDASIFHVGQNMRDKAFDLMVKNRIIKPQPDQDIIIVDINEASLAAMAGEYGRWPWPRQVLGEFVENIETQQPKAVVFDILFSDPDIYNPDSDAYFNEVIANTKNTYFPMLRLPEEQDKISRLKASQIPGVRISPELEANKDTTVAMILPYFQAVRDSKRLGTHNIKPDSDGIVREYPLWQFKDGWRIPALPLVVGEPTPTSYLLPQNMLINWRGKPFTYPTVSFSDVFADMGKKEKTRSQNEFTDKIVIIGSTAPSLGDIKATTMANLYPGVEILATAIDNVKHRDYLKVWRGNLPYVFISLLLIWATTLAFFRNVDRDRLISLFSFSQIGLLVFSYLAINFTNTYLDLTAPIAWAMLYFSVAKIYSLATERAMQRLLATDNTFGTVGTQVQMMLIVIESEEPLSDSLLKRIQHQIQTQCTQPTSIEILKGTQSGIWGLFGDMLVINWIYNTDNQAAVEADATQLANKRMQLVTAIGIPISTQVRYSFHHATLDPTQVVANQWRCLFAQTVLKLDHPELKG